MYQLYYAPGTCSMAIHVVLNEIGKTFEGHKISFQDGDNRKPEFLKINPRGAVPVLVENGKIIREGAAILIHLMESNNSPLLPKSGPERATALEWLMFANATLHPAYGRVFFLMKHVTDKATQEPLVKAAIEMIDKLWAEVDTQLGKTPYICGDNVTAADILMTVIANWGGYLPVQPTFGPNVKRLLKEISSRPSYQKALQAEGVEYKAAA